MKNAKRTFAAMLAAVTAMLCLSGCFGQKYAVDYDGKKDLFDGAKDSYRAGEKVKLCFRPATDTDYRFYLDGEELERDYDEDKGFILTFKMPAHDVKLTYTSSNSMTDPAPVFEKEAELSFHSFDGGGPKYALKTEDGELFSYTSERNYGKKNHAELDGASYEVVYTFKGLKAGSGSFTITEYSPIDGSEYDYIYDFTVNDALAINVEARD